MGAAKTKAVAVGGLLVALTLISLFLATILPTNRLSFYALSSFPIAIIVMEYGIKRGWMFYAASTLLGVIIVPNKLAVVPFIVFFGIYGAIKYHIELLRNIYAEFGLKLLYFNLWLAVFFVMAKEVLLGGNLQLAKFPLWLLILGLEAVFIVYDYVYTLFIQYFNTRLKRILKL